MTSDQIPIATVLTAPVNARAAMAPATFAEPVTPEEVAALARRIRVEAKLSRITVAGTVLGLVCGVAAVWPFLDSHGYMAKSLAGRGGLGALGFLPGWLLAGLLPLLAFYAGRLQLESGRSSTGMIETSLRKIRRVILGCMFASVAAFVVVLAERQRARHGIDAASWLTLMYAGCFAACGLLISDVRRGLGDFDSDYQRSRRKLARGFAVQLRPVETPASGDAIPFATRAAPASDAAIPLATLGPPTALPAMRAGDAAASTPVPALPIAAPLQLTATPPPPFPGEFPAPRTWPAAAVDVGEDEHAKDLRLLMTLAVAVAISVYAVRLGEDLMSGLRRAEDFSLGATLLTRDTFGAPNSLATSLVLLAEVATMLLVPCAALWLVWGILSLNYGPTFRRTVGCLTVVTLVLGVLCVLPGWVYARSDAAYRPERSEIGMLSRAPEVIHALFLAMLLTRPGVKRLFARGSGTDDPD